MAGRAGLFERNGSKNLTHRSDLIGLNVAYLAIEARTLLCEVEIAMLDVIEFNALGSAVWIVLEFWMVRRKGPNIFLMARLALFRCDLL